jgi:hypothetical protein
MTDSFSNSSPAFDVDTIFFLNLVYDVHLVMVLSCISFLAYDIEHFFMCSFVEHMSSSVKGLFIPFVYFLVSFPFFFLLFLLVGLGFELRVLHLQK